MPRELHPCCHALLPGLPASASVHGCSQVCAIVVTGHQGARPRPLCSSMGAERIANSTCHACTQLTVCSRCCWQAVVRLFERVRLRSRAHSTQAGHAPDDGMRRIAPRAACGERERALCAMTGPVFTALGPIPGRLMRAINGTYGNDLGRYPHLHRLDRAATCRRRFYAHFL